MKKRKILASILIASLCCGLFLVLTACEPLPIFKGVTVCGVALNGVSEVELKSVDFDFNIIDYPDIHDEEVNSNSSVKATYAMSNATSSDVIVPMYLTVGAPQYEYSKFDIVASCERYKFTASTEQETFLRSVYYQELEYYDNDNAIKVTNFLKCLHDEKQTDSHYNDGLPIYKYTYAISKTSENVYTVRYTHTKGDDEMLFFNNEISLIDDGIIGNYTYYYMDIDGANTLTFYSVGKEFANDGRLYVEGGSVTYVSCEVVSFDDLAMSFYDEESGVLEADWYNAVLGSINRTNLSNVHNIKFFDMTGKLYYMYQCNLTVPAQSDASLGVEMPLYPTINCDDYTVNVYEYEVNLSGLSNWRGVPNVSVSVKTGGYYVDSSYQIKQTSTGYDVLNVDSTTQCFFFTLSETPDFESVSAANEKTERRVLISLFVIVGLCYSVPIVTVSVVLGCDNAKRKKARKAAEEATSADVNII